jgi:hypothetical protein
MTADKPAWTLKGTVVIACNCDYGCPCNFNARPTHGKCEGGWTWHVTEGSFGRVRLDGLTFSLFVNWPGAIHEGGGEALVLIDERADEEQRQAISTLVSGEVGGPWGTLAWTWPTVHGPKLVAYEIELNGVASRIRAGDALEVESRNITNPVNGAQVHPAIVLPEGIIVKTAELGCSSVFRVGADLPMDHSGQYTAVGPFEYAGQ